MQFIEFHSGVKHEDIGSGSGQQCGLEGGNVFLVEEADMVQFHIGVGFPEQPVHPVHGPLCGRVGVLEIPENQAPGRNRRDAGDSEKVQDEHDFTGGGQSRHDFLASQPPHDKLAP